MTESILHKLLRTIAQEISEVDANIYAIEESRDVSNLFGDLLTKYGETLGIKRKRYIDSKYQQIITHHLRGRFSTGTVDEIKKYVANYLGINTSEIKITEDTPGHFEIAIPFSYKDDSLEDFIKVIKPVGVSFTLTWVASIWDESVWDEDLWS